MMFSLASGLRLGVAVRFDPGLDPTRTCPSLTCADGDPWKFLLAPNSPLGWRRITCSFRLSPKLTYEDTHPLLSAWLAFPDLLIQSDSKSTRKGAFSHSPPG